MLKKIFFYDLYIHQDDFLNSEKMHILCLPILYK